MEISIRDIIRYLLCIVLIVSKKCTSNILDIDDMASIDTMMWEPKQMLREPRKYEGNSWIWQNYKFGSGVGNREELCITNIEVWQDIELTNDIKNWQILRHKNDFYFAGTKDTTLLLYHFNVKANRTSLHDKIFTNEKIKSFKIISLPQFVDESLKNNVVVVLSLENKNEVHNLKWFYLHDKRFVQFWTWETVKSVKNLEYFNMNDRHKLILLYEKDVLFNESFSLVEIYDIKTDIHSSKSQLCERFLVSETYDLDVCPSRKETTMISLLGKDHVMIYEYKDENIVKCTFKQIQNITISGLTNTICFESGYINYLATSGFISNLFKLKKNNFVNDKEMEEIFYEIGTIKSIQYVPMDTYRHEVILFIQLKNSTIKALSWNGSNFKPISMVDNVLNEFHLSKLTVIPNYGFLVGNVLIKINIKLKQLFKSNENEVKNMLEAKTILQDLLVNQEQTVLKTNQLIKEEQLNNFEEDFLNSSDIEIQELNAKKAYNLPIILGPHKINLYEMEENYDNALTLIDRIEMKFNQIEHIIANTLVSNLDTDKVYNEFNVIGNLEIKGKLLANDLTIDILNNSSMKVLINQCKKVKTKIFGLKSFSSIEFLNNKFKFKSLNGIPLRDIQFEDMNKDYSDFNLLDISKLEINNLNVSVIHGIHWDNLIEKLVFKNVKKVISHSTVIVGQIDVAHLRLDYLNELQYPYTYVLKSDPEEIDITSDKTFQSLRVSNLKDVKTINGIDADEFVILHADQSLKHQITFENLVIDKSLQIDGDIVGLPQQDIDPDKTLLNSNIVQTNAMFTNLYISGNIYIKNSINGTDWSKLNDLILQDENNTIVTGIKTFLGNVHIVGDLEIKTSIINNHFVQDFITLDTRQVLPKLSSISGNVRFLKVTYKELEILEDKINFNLHQKIFSSCMSKPLIFMATPIIDEFSSLYINENLKGSEFSNKVKSLLGKTVFEHLKVKKLVAENLITTTINSVDIYNFQTRKISKTGYQILSGNITIENLAIKKLYTELVNGRSVTDLENIVHKMNLFYNKILGGSMPINSLTVTKYIVTSKINEENLNSILDVNFTEQFIFRTNQVIKNVAVEGLVNKINITRKANDLVLLNEENVVFKGPKKLKKLKSNNLKIELINGHLIDDVIRSDKNQFLAEPLKIIGSVIVEKVFESTGQFNNIIFEDIKKTIYQVDKNLFKLNGKFFITDDSIIKDLNVYGHVQKKNIDNFVEDLIFLDEKSISVPGEKIFNASINFTNEIFLRNNLNDINLQHFFENTFLIDNQFSLSSIIFNSDTLIEGDLVIQNNLRTSTIKKINIDELMENALYLNRPTYVNEIVVLSNAIFESNIIVNVWNDTEIENLFLLNKSEIMRNTLMCIDVTVNKLEIQGLINTNNLTEIYENTLSLSKNQNIKGTLTFLNNVYIKNNFNSKIINKIDMDKTTSLKYADQMDGNFVFNNIIGFNKKLSVSRNLNGKNLEKWLTSVITIHSPITEILGDWILMHNSVFQNTLHGSGLINGINMTKFGENIENQITEMQFSLSEQTKKLNNICQGLKRLKSNAENMLYKFKSFEYLRVLDFDQTISSIHYFELRNTDYIMVNFESCNLDVFAYTSEGFVLAANISNFGYVKQFITLYYKDRIYFVTTGKSECGKNAGNLWSFENHEFKYVLDLGNVTDIQKLDDDSFVVIVDRQVQEWSVKLIYENVFEPVNVIPVRDKNIQFFTNNNETLLASRDAIYSLRSEDLEFEEYENPFDTNDILSFQAGILKKDYILFFDEFISEDYIYLCNNDLSQRRVLQAIKARKPSTFLVINFPGFQETLLIYSENRRKIQIYEYSGIENFKYHSSIKMKVDKLFNFELGIYPYNTKSPCLFVIQDRKLVILKAVMFGEKLSMNENFFCDVV